MSRDDGVLRFLQTKTETEKLEIALGVLEEFKSLESMEEWVGLPFLTWAKLEQLQDCLRLLTGCHLDRVTGKFLLETWRKQNSTSPDLTD